MLFGFFICVSIILSVELFFMGMVVGFFQKKFFIYDILRFIFAALLTTLLLSIGYVLGSFSSGFFPNYTIWYAATVLFLLGGKMFYQALKTHKVKQLINPLDLKGLIFLSILAGLNALFIGISFGLMGLENSLLYLSFLVLLLALLLGYLFGFSRKILPSVRYEIVSGIIYIIIAVIIVIKL